jgi:threonine/homoserine/homoserine lactone efflux protein
MPDTATYFAFLTAVLVMQVTPGPDMMLVIGRGVGQGQRIAFCTVLGFTAAGIIQVALLEPIPVAVIFSKKLVKSMLSQCRSDLQG